MPKTIPVRIALCVNANGDWSAHGGLGYTDEDYLIEAGHEPGDAVYWVLAGVRKPKPIQHPEIVGTVVPAEADG